MSRAKAKFIEEMRREMPVQSYLGQYLVWLNSENPEGAELLKEDLRKTFHTEEGLRVLKMLEKSVLHVGVPNGASDGALREMNAVRNFVLEIRRLVANG